MYAARQARRAIFSCLTLILSDDTVLIFIVFLEKLMKIMDLNGALNIHFKCGGPGTQVLPASPRLASAVKLIVVPL